MTKVKDRMTFYAEQEIFESIRTIANAKQWSATKTVEWLLRERLAEIAHLYDTSN